MAISYNAIVCGKEPWQRAKYRNITNVERFVQWVENNMDFVTIMFYRKTSQLQKKGEYCGYYSKKSGWQVNW